MKDFELPFALDKVTKKPSLMLFFGTVVFYRARRIDSFKFNLEEKSLEVDSDGKEEDDK
jgi:hypothetical protein